MSRNSLPFLPERQGIPLGKKEIYNVLDQSRSGISRTYLIPEDPDKVFVPDTQDISSNSNNNLLTENLILEEANLEQSTQADIT